MRTAETLRFIRGKTLPLNGGFEKSQPLVLAQMIIDAKVNPTGWSAGAFL